MPAVVAVALLSLPLLAAVSGSAQGAPAVASPVAVAPAPTAAKPTGGVDLSPVMSQLQLASQVISQDFLGLRVDRWKADAGQKQLAQHNADSVSRNLSGALPGLIEQVRRDPQSMAAAFKLYRNVSALYEVISSVTESAGAFGAKSEYQALSSDLANLDEVRRRLGERLQEMAAAGDSELRALRLQAIRPAAPPPAPKKIVVDDGEKPARPVRTKKKPANASAPIAPVNPPSTTQAK